MRIPKLLLLVAAGFVVAAVINFTVLPGNHMVSSLYLLPVLVVCYRWRAAAVAAAAACAALLYSLSALTEGRPILVWAFGVLALTLAGFLAVRFAVQREQIALLARRETEDRRRLQVFVSMVAHDLAGAMTNVRAGMEMLERYGRRDGAEEEQIAGRAIDGGVHQMERLLGDLRDAAAIGSDTFAVRPAPMDLVETVRQVVDRQRLLSKRHRLNVETPGRLDGVWDRERIAQLLGNLVSNACKYSPDGGDVDVTVRGDANVVTIAVRDQGIGIDEGKRTIIFEPFARLQARDDLPGTGLGLWIAKAIVDGHGGRIWVESAVGAGSTFSVALPVAPASGSLVEAAEHGSVEPVVGRAEGAAATQIGNPLVGRAVG